MEPLTPRAAALSGRIARADATVRAEALALGIEALPAITPHLHAPDWRVREACALALDGVARAAQAASGPALDSPPELEDALLALARDERPVVRRTAVVSLAQVATPRSTETLDATATAAKDPHERFRAALALGARALLGRDDLRARHEKEEHPAAALGWLLARAKCGDPEAQTTYVEKLRTDRTGEIAPHLQDYLPYLTSDWVARGLRSWLDERSAGIFLGHGLTPEVLRVCDSAVMALAAHTTLEFPFAIASRHYTDAELDLARARVDELVAERR